MKVCLMLEGQEGITWDNWLALALAAEEAGLDGLFSSDHYRSIVREHAVGGLDTWALLAATAARTTRVRLGTLVSPVTFRSASVLAKNAVTVDHISGGRLELGLGAGWYEPDHSTYRIPFGTQRSRLDELDRQLAEIHRQWLEDDTVQPKPVQRPRPPIIVGGTAKPRTVAAAVRFADEYNTYFASVDEVRERKRIVDAAANAAGRPPLRFSLMYGSLLGTDRRNVKKRLERWHAVTGQADPPRFVGTPEQVAEQLAPYGDAGVERVMLQHLHHEDVEMVGLLGELARLVA